MMANESDLRQHQYIKRGGRDGNWTNGGIQMHVYTNGDEDDSDEDAYINLTDEAIDELIEALQKSKK